MSTSGNEHEVISPNGTSLHGTTPGAAVATLRKAASCPICLDWLDSPVLTPCGHCFCKECLLSALAIRDSCPMCSHRFTTARRTLADVCNPVVNLLKQVSTLVERLETPLQKSSVSSTLVTSAFPTSTSTENGTNSTVSTNYGGAFTPPPAARSLLPANAIFPTVRDVPSSPRATNGQHSVPNDFSEGFDWIKGYRLVFGGDLPIVPSPTPSNNGYLPSTRDVSAAATALATAASQLVTVDDEQIDTHDADSTEVLPELLDDKRVANENSSKSDTASKKESESSVFPLKSLVTVAKRTWAGSNKLGGTGSVSAIEYDENGEVLYTVTFVTGGRETRVPAKYVSQFVELPRASRRAVTASPVSTRRLPDIDFGSYSPRTAAALLAAMEGDMDWPASVWREVVKHDLPSPPNPSRDSVSTKTSPRKRSTIPSSKESTKRVCVEEEIPSVEKPFVVLCSSIDSRVNFDRKLHKLGSDFAGRFTVATEFSPAVTHLIVSVDRSGTCKQRTMKYLQAISAGIWILSSQWVSDCAKEQKFLPEVEYEVKDNIKSTCPEAPRRSRESFTKYGRSVLFEGLTFLFYGGFALPGPSRDVLEGLVTKCGATTVSSPTALATLLLEGKPCIVVVDRATRITLKEVADAFLNISVDALTTIEPSILSETITLPILDAPWVLDSITDYKMRDISLYRFT